MKASNLIEEFEREEKHRWGEEAFDTILRALRLLAAAEANDGTEAKVLPSFIAEQLCSDYSRGKCGDPNYDDCSCQRLVRGYEQINNERNGLAARVRELEAALKGMVDIYVSLVNCGDCGNWNPEKENEVIGARAALEEE